MKQPTPIAVALSGALLLAGAGETRALSGDEEAACGAILCLVGGSGVAECAPYLARYFAIDAANPARLFDKRLDFLNLCPAPDLPGDVRPMIARYGATCQPTQLVSFLNAQIRLCEMRSADGSGDCRPTGDEWRICAPLYDHAYTTYEAPRLHERCQRQPDGDGYLAEHCTYTWIEASVIPPATAPATLPGFGPLPGFAPTGFGLPSD